MRPCRASLQPTIRVNEAFTAGGAGQIGRSATRARSSSRRTSTSRIGRKHSMRAGVLLESGWWDSTQRSNGNGTYTFTSLDAYNAGTPDQLRDSRRRSAGRLLADQGRLVPAGRLPSVADAAAQLRAAPGDSDAGRFEVEPRAARGVHLERHQEDHHARRLRHLLRLVRIEPLRADDSRRRRTTRST